MTGLRSRSGGSAFRIQRPLLEAVHGLAKGRFAKLSDHSNRTFQNPRPKSSVNVSFFGVHIGVFVV
jgi:hypothetical protein